MSKSHPEASRNAEDERALPARGVKLWDQCTGGRWSCLKVIYHHLVMVVMGVAGC